MLFAIRTILMLVMVLILFDTWLELMKTKYTGINLLGFYFIEDKVIEAAYAKVDQQSYIEKKNVPFYWGFISQLYFE